jgi:hypothetical protein
VTSRRQPIAELDRDELLKATCAPMHSDIEDEESWATNLESTADGCEARSAWTLRITQRW